jgi:hypothetical protein
MNARTEWTTEDFDDMSWHDVHVHGFRIDESDDENAGTAELYLDIDYILRWGVREETGVRFVVAQAMLRFHDVFGLKFCLDYKRVSAGMCAFSLDGIKREVVTYPNGHRSYRWSMEINWPAGLIEFTSPGFTQRLIGEIFPDSGLSLPPSRRKPWQPI